MTPQQVEVPIIATLSPRSIAPALNVAIGASIPPATTGVPAGRPHFSAAAEVTSPTTSVEATNFSGIFSRGIPNALLISSDQRRCLMSKIPPRFPADE